MHEGGFRAQARTPALVFFIVIYCKSKETNVWGMLLPGLGPEFL